MIQCPECHLRNYNRVRNGEVKESYEDGKLIATGDYRTQWGYICRDCGCQWGYEKGKVVLGWD